MCMLSPCRKTNNDTLDRVPSEVLTDIRSLADYSSVYVTKYQQAFLALLLGRKKVY